MKKSNRIFTIAFVLFIVVSFTVTACQKKGSKLSQNHAEHAETSTATITQTTTVLHTEPTTAQITQEESKVNREEKMLFIGDSRAVGLAEYGKMENTDFFANVGMSVYNIQEKKLSVPNVGKVTLEELLNHKQYDKIYIMLGINEAGYNRAKTVQKYQQLIDYIFEKEPNAKLFLQANLHVTNERSKKDKVINNPTIDALNSEISKLADSKSIYYMDANPLFDDANASLSKEKTGDSAHLYAKYYAQWGAWIVKQTESICKG